MRIMIVGYSGSGKSTLAKNLGNFYGCDVLYMDTVQFESGWKDRDKQEALDMVNDFMNSHDSWIIDGNYKSRFFERRAKEADKIIFMNFNRFVCLKRVIERKIKYKGKSRESMTQGCEEKIDLEFIWWVLYEGRNLEKRKRYLNLKEEYPDKFLEFKNSRQVDDYLRGLGINSIII